MKIKFIGPIGRVTGSCYHLVNEGLGEEYLVDCGIMQGELKAAEWNAGPLPFDPRKIRHVFLTHAHMDHCGLLPRLYKEGYSGVVWCTRETAELAKINLIDSAQFSDYKYGQDDVMRIQWKEPNRSPLFNNMFPIANDLFGSFFRSSHLLGAVSFTLTWGPPQAGKQRAIVFSGDLGNNADGGEYQSLLKYRMNERGRDYIVCESTYGAVVRPEEYKDWSIRLDRLSVAINPPLAAGGTVVFPVFALGRAQDLIFDLACVFARNPARYADVEVVLDSTMANKVSRVYAEGLKRTELNRQGQAKTVWRNSRLLNWLGLSDSAADHDRLGRIVEDVLLGLRGKRRDIPQATGRLADSLVPIHNIADSKDRERFEESAGPRIILATGGMCEVGPVVGYLYHLATDPRNAVVFSGYQAPGTLGGFLQSLGDVSVREREKLSGSLEFPMFEKRNTLARKDVKISIFRLPGYSGHADQTGLCDWVIPPQTGKPVAPRVFVSHGEESSRVALRDALLARSNDSIEVILPKPTDGWFDLDLGVWVEGPDLDPLAAAQEKIRELQAALAAAQSRG